MTDSAWLLSVLADGTPHTHAEILRRSELERGHGLTVHSRAADLRKLGHNVKVTTWRANGRRHSSYRLVLCAEPQAPSFADRERGPACGSADQTSLFRIPASVRGAYDEAAA